MKIDKVDVLHCAAGWRPWTFVKIETDEGIVGYSECTDSHGSPHGLAATVKDLSRHLIGKDPRAVEAHFWAMYRATRQSTGSIIQKAIGGIENALLDVKAKALGIPVYELFGGPVVREMPVYWSHCGTTRVRAAQMVGVEPVRTLKDIHALGREVAERGFGALKTNVLVLGEEPYVHMPGFGKGTQDLSRNVSSKLLDHIVSLIGTFRDAVGPGIGLCLDLNFNFRTEGCIKIAKALEPFDMLWLELDSYDPDSVRTIQDASPMPVCSGENLYTLWDFRPYFEKHSMRVAMIDVPWNGFSQSKKIAEVAEVYDMSVGPHNYYSHLSTFMSAHFGAVIPNLRILEVDVDDVPWKEDLTTGVPDIRNGVLHLTKGPGWGVDINEQVCREHPWPE